MGLHDVLDLLAGTDFDLTFLLRIGEIPPPLLHTFACDCVEHLLTHPLWAAHPRVEDFRALLEVKRLWIEGRLSTAVLEAQVSSLERSCSEAGQAQENDGLQAILAAALTEPFESASLASERAAWASYDIAFDQALEDIGPLLLQNPLLRWLEAPRPAWQKLSALVLAPRRAISQLSQALRLGFSQITGNFRTSFAARKREKDWQRERLAALIRLYQMGYFQILALLQSRLRRPDDLQRWLSILEESVFSG